MTWLCASYTIGIVACSEGYEKLNILNVEGRSEVDGNEIELEIVLG